LRTINCSEKNFLLQLKEKSTSKASTGEDTCATRLSMVLKREPQTLACVHLRNHFRKLKLAVTFEALFGPENFSNSNSETQLTGFL